MKHTFWMPSLTERSQKYRTQHSYHWMTKKGKYIPESYKRAKEKDTLWMLDLFVNNADRIAMWVDWNALLYQKWTDREIQKIVYLPQINESPTSHSVIAETMRRSQKIAQECQKESIAVTYDLAIAKIAFQIQNEESPKFDDVFILLGPFHQEFVIFKALGKFIVESASPHILVETGMLAGISMRGFISGKTYNRCKRLHGLLSSAFQLLHFEEFLNSLDGTTDGYIEEIREAINLFKYEERAENDHIFSKEFTDIIHQYEQYTWNTLNGTHGKTWVIYIQIMSLYRQFIRSIRIGDFDLYVHCMPQIANLCLCLQPSKLLSPDCKVP